MRDTILEFLEHKKVAIVGASNKKDNFGRGIMEELRKKEYEVIPVNPKYDEVEGVPTVPSLRDLPEDVECAILAVPASLTEEIVDQAIGSPVKRVWMIQGVGKGAYTAAAHEKCKENGIAVVYGFCPMMFYGEGFHKFHFWLRKTFGKMPQEYLVGEN